LSPQRHAIAQDAVRLSAPSLTIRNERNWIAGDALGDIRQGHCLKKRLLVLTLVSRVYAQIDSKSFGDSLSVLLPECVNCHAIFSDFNAIGGLIAVQLLGRERSNSRDHFDVASICGHTSAIKCW
jgi:hypothetical protein